MAEALAAGLAVLALALLVPCTLLLIEVLAAMPPRRPQPMPVVPRPRIAVVVPAHDEALVIEKTLSQLRAQLVPRDRLLVVADNCSDATAAIARAAGAEVVERRDATHRGKGYALDFGVQHLAADPPDVLVIVDADCDVAPGAIERLAKSCIESRRPAQALYLMEVPAGAGINARVRVFAWLVKNEVRPLGGLRLGIPCQLMGTGMAFTWQSVSAIPLATGHIAEDVLFGIALARAGTPPLFCPDALVTSRLATSIEGAASQRRRWEHGNLALLTREAPRLLRTGLLRGNARLVGMALDLAVPPLALLALSIFIVSAASAAHAYALGGVTPVAIAGMGAAMLSVSVGLAWARYGRNQISLVQLAYAPIYALAKVPLYVAFVARRQMEWVRTRRDG